MFTQPPRYPTTDQTLLPSQPRHSSPRNPGGKSFLLRRIMQRMFLFIWLSWVSRYEYVFFSHRSLYQMTSLGSSRSSGKNTKHDESASDGLPWHSVRPVSCSIKIQPTPGELSLQACSHSYSEQNCLRFRYFCVPRAPMSPSVNPAAVHRSLYLFTSTRSFRRTLRIHSVGSKVMQAIYAVWMRRTASSVSSVSQTLCLPRVQVNQKCF
jgi:hypothetical protein